MFRKRQVPVDLTPPPATAVAEGNEQAREAKLDARARKEARIAHQLIPYINQGLELIKRDASGTIRHPKFCKASVNISVGWRSVAVEFSGYSHPGYGIRQHIVAHYVQYGYKVEGYVPNHWQSDADRRKRKKTKPDHSRYFITVTVPEKPAVRPAVKSGLSLRKRSRASA